MPSPKRPAVWDPVIDEIQRRGLPMTKSSYVRAMFAPDDPEFPLDAEIEAAVPAEMPGRMPQELTDLYPAPSSSRPTSRRDRAGRSSLGSAASASTSRRRATGIGSAAGRVETDVAVGGRDRRRQPSHRRGGVESHAACPTAPRAVPAWCCTAPHAWRRPDSFAPARGNAVQAAGAVPPVRLD